MLEMFIDSVHIWLKEELSYRSVYSKYFNNVQLY